MSAKIITREEKKKTKERTVISLRKQEDELFLFYDVMLLVILKFPNVALHYGIRN